MTRIGLAMVLLGLGGCAAEDPKSPEDSDRGPIVDDSGSGSDDTSVGSIDSGDTDPPDDADDSGVDDTGAPVVSDADGDGFTTADGDCDDLDGRVHPGADEVCNETDDDCDGEVDEEAIDRTPFYRDDDGDGFGYPIGAVMACSVPEGRSADATDCDDAAATVFPGADETCNDTDDDCDGEVDEEAIEMTIFYADADFDGYGDPDVRVFACDRPSGTVSNDGDCNDSAADAHPGALEFCDEIDNDCNGVVDDATIGLTSFFPDADGDGHAVPGVAVESCFAPPFYSALVDDCDDGEPSVHPGAPELCDGLDNDCDGATDTEDPEGSADMVWYVDSDGDGYGDGGEWIISCEPLAGYAKDATDCDDLDASVHPGAEEVTCNDIDEDCDGTDICLASCGDGIVGPGEEYDPAPGPFTSVTVDEETCRWDFSGARQLACDGPCSWSGDAGCDSTEADTLCKLITDDPAAVADSWSTISALDEPGFACALEGYGVEITVTDRGVDGRVAWEDITVLGSHGTGWVIADPVCVIPVDDGTGAEAAD